MAVRDDVLADLDRLIEEGRQVCSSYSLVEWGHLHSSLDEVAIQSFVGSALASIERVSGRDGAFLRQLPPGPAQGLRDPGLDASHPSVLTGVLVALRRAIEGGYLTSLERRLRANVYDDFLTQAGELLAAGYHVAAVVLAGGVLEDHLRKLCESRGLAWAGCGSLSKYNDLLKDRAYAQPTWRRIQSVADLRNHAAHGDGAKVNAGDAEDCAPLRRPAAGRMPGVTGAARPTSCTTAWGSRSSTSELAGRPGRHDGPRETNSRSTSLSSSNTQPAASTSSMKPLAGRPSHRTGSAHSAGTSREPTTNTTTPGLPAHETRSPARISSPLR